jgi:hypothetical protein
MAGILFVPVSLAGRLFRISSKMRIVSWSIGESQRNHDPEDSSFEGTKTRNDGKSMQMMILPGLVEDLEWMVSSPSQWPMGCI